MNQAKVIKAYSASSSDPILLEAGDKVSIGGKDSPWAGWVWCTSDAGKSGWVPESYLDRSGDSGVANQAYTGEELTVGAGDELRALYDESGWYWCLSDGGDSGWVPGDHLEIS